MKTSGRDGDVHFLHTVSVFSAYTHDETLQMLHFKCRAYHKPIMPPWSHLIKNVLQACVRMRSTRLVMCTEQNFVCKIGDKIICPKV